MKLSILLILVSLSVTAQEPWSNKSRVLPDDLREIPTAIQIWHTNNPNYPEIAKGLVKTKSKYVWRHATSMTSVYEDLEVIKAGSYIWYNEEGWKRNVEYTKKDFSKYFQCKKGQMIKGKAYTFDKNYRYGDQLYGGDALWYVIAKDKSGKIYKGIGIIETEAKLDQK